MNLLEKAEKLLNSSHSIAIQRIIDSNKGNIYSVLIWEGGFFRGSEVVLYFEHTGNGIGYNIFKLAPTKVYDEDISRIKFYHRIHSLASEKVFELPLLFSTIGPLTIHGIEAEVLKLSENAIFEGSSINKEPIFITNVPYIGGITLNELYGITLDPTISVQIIQTIQYILETELNINCTFQNNGEVIPQLLAHNIKVSLRKVGAKNVIRFIVTDLACLINEFIENNKHLI